jgi:hypothetical protein
VASRGLESFLALEIPKAGRAPEDRLWSARSHPTDQQGKPALGRVPVPTLTFERLFAFLVLGHGRRQLLWFEVTRHPTAEWLARQITEAFPWASAPAYLVRDNDGAYGRVFTSRLRAMGKLIGELIRISQVLPSSKLRI